MLGLLTQKISQVEGYTHFNYALFSGSIYNLFDHMRYDSAFFVRQADIAMLKKHIKEKHWEPLPSPILLAKYSYSKQPMWTHAKLLSDQRLTEVVSVEELYNLGSDIFEMKLPYKLKYRVEITVEGKIEDMITLLYEHSAVPASEADAHRIENAYNSPEENLSVTMAYYDHRQ